MTTIAHSERLFGELEEFLSNSSTCRGSFQMLVHLSINMAAEMDTRRVLEIVDRSAERDLFSPLAAGIRIYLGEPSQAVGQADRLARQIADRIADTAALRGQRVTAA